MKSAMLPFLVLALGLAACAAPPTPAPTEPPTSTPTRTPVPSATSTPAPTSTATPVSTFAPAVVSNPATEVVDARVVVLGENVKVIFYMRDVPTELSFQREGIRINYDEYTWQLCVDADNDKSTGMPSAFVEGAFESGADYCLTAMNFRRDVAPQTAPIEEAVQANVWATSSKSMKVISEADLEVDPVADTLTLSGVIPGITEDSLFYYYTLDRNPGGKPQVQGGQLLDRVSLE